MTYKNDRLNAARKHPIRVVIVDDHPMVRDGLRSILETYPDLDLVGSLVNGQEAIDQVAKLQPDVMLLDLNMPGVNGLSATEIILERFPAVRILILSMHDSPEYVSTALSHGAKGYILKDVPTEEVYTAIVTVMTGKNYLCTGASAALHPLDRKSVV